MHPRFYPLLGRSCPKENEHVSQTIDECCSVSHRQPFSQYGIGPTQPICQSRRRHATLLESAASVSFRVEPKLSPVLLRSYGDRCLSHSCRRTDGISEYDSLEQPDGEWTSHPNCPRTCDCRQRAKRSELSPIFLSTVGPVSLVPQASLPLFQSRPASVSQLILVANRIVRTRFSHPSRRVASCVENN